jgi:hypothetical protein
MFISIVFLIIIAIIFAFAAVYARAGKVKQKHIQEAEKRGDMQEARRLKDMSDDQAGDEFEDEL